MKKIICTLFASIISLFAISITCSAEVTLDTVQDYLDTAEFYAHQSQQAPSAVSDAGEESTSSAGGNLSYSATDLNLAGVNGMDVNIRRTFNTADSKDGLAIQRRTVADEQHNTKKYVFKYLDAANNTVYIAYDSPKDMLVMENGTNSIRVDTLSNNLHTLDEIVRDFDGYDNTVISYYVSSNDIGFSEDSSYYYIGDFQSGDVVLTRDTSVGYAGLSIKSVNTYVFSNRKSKAYDIFDNGWKIEVPTMIYYPCKTKNKSLGSIFLDTGSFYDSEMGMSVNFSIQYYFSENKYIEDDIDVYTYMEEGLLQKNYRQIPTNMYQLSYTKSCNAGFIIEISRYDGKIFRFIVPLDYTPLYAVEENITLEKSYPADLDRITDRFGNKITFTQCNSDGIIIQDTLNRTIVVNDSGVTVNGRTAVEYAKSTINNSVVDPNNKLIFDDTEMFTVKNKLNGKQVSYSASRSSMTYLVGVAGDNYNPCDLTTNKDVYLMDKITLPTGSSINYEYAKYSEPYPFFTNVTESSYKLVKKYMRKPESDAEHNRVDFSYAQDESGIRQTTVIYGGNNAYTEKTSYDKYGNEIKSEQISTEEGNSYYKCTDKEYTIHSSVGDKIKLPRQVVSSATITVKPSETSDSATVTEMEYSYDDYMRILTVTRDSDVVESYSYNRKYGIPTSSYKLKDNDELVGTVNSVTTNGKSIASSSISKQSPSDGSSSTYETVSYTYNTAGEVITAKKGSVTINYTYDYANYSINSNKSAASLVVTESVTSVDAIASSETSPTIRNQKTYDLYSRLITDKNGKNIKTKYEYSLDDANNLYNVTTKSVNSNDEENLISTVTYNYVDNVITTTDADGVMTKTEYTPLGQEWLVYNYNSETDTWENPYENVYDLNGRIIFKKEFNDDGTEKARIEYTYYADNSVKSEEIYTGLTTVSKKTFTYEPYYNNDSSRVGADVYLNEQDKMTVYRYTDKYGRLTRDETVADGHTYAKKYTSDYNGNITAVWDRWATWFNHTNPTETYEYDYADRLIKTTNEAGSTISKYSDKTGYLTSKTDANGNTTSYVYNKLGLVKTMNSPYGDGKKVSTSYLYDKTGNVVKQSIGGQVVRSSYDDLGRLISTEAVDEDAPEVVKYVYSDGGRLLKQATGLSSRTDDIDETVHEVINYTYDGCGRLASQTDALGHTSTYTYNILGQKTSETDRNGNVITYSYDALGRIESISAAKEGETTQNISYTYDWVGNVLSMTDNTGTTEYSYDNRGLLMRETRGDTVKNYSYDMDGRRMGFSVPSKSLLVMYTYDSVGRLNKVTQNGVVTVYSYDANSNVTGIETTENGISTVSVSMEYDSANLLKSKTSISGYVSESYEMSYYPTGNLQSVTSNGETVDYTYDGVGRIKTGKGASYTYDAFGNIASVTDELDVTTYTYDKNNRLLNASGQYGWEQLSYDNNGNVTDGLYVSYFDYDARSENQGATMTAADTSVKTFSYTYDTLGRMTGSSKTGRPSAVYTYDGNGLRLTKNDTSYVYDGTDIVYDENENTSNTYIRGLGLIARSTNDDTPNSYYLSNNHGDITKLVKDGEPIANYTYSDFGKSATVSADTNPFRYCGEYTDEETGLIYLRARYYDPSIGRFTQEDPIRDGFNWYVYCNNNPISFIDALGLAPTATQAASMAAHIYDYDMSNDQEKRTIDGWRLISVWYGRQTMKMGIYIRDTDDWQNPSEYTVVFKGTNPLSGTEWMNNAEQFLSAKSADMWDAINYSKGFVEGHSQEITFVGHSKGGAEALASAVATGKNAIVFNPAKPNLKDYNLSASNYNGTATSYVVRGEVLNNIFGEPRVGTTQYLPKQHTTPWYVVGNARIVANTINAVLNHLMSAVNAGLKEAGY